MLPTCIPLLILSIIQCRVPHLHQVQHTASCRCGVVVGSAQPRDHGTRNTRTANTRSWQNLRRHINELGHQW
jgi:hypothetical protein